MATPTSTVQSAPREPKTATRSLWIGLLFVSPVLIGFLVFTLYPVVASLYFSFTDYNILQAPRWVGLENYRTLLTKDPVFMKALKNTGYMVLIGLPLHLIFDLLIAMLLNVKIRGQALFRLIFYLPSITPAVASSVLWLWIFNPQYGLANAFLKGIGLSAVGWLADPVWAKPALILMGLWYGGNTIIIFLAALQEVPTDLYEAADLDGAGALRQAWHITFPMISPVILFNLVIGLIGYFQYFTEAWVMTQGSGGPGQSLMFYGIYLYQNAFVFLRMGLASAMAWLLMLLVLAVTLLVFGTSKKWVFYQGS